MEQSRIELEMAKDDTTKILATITAAENNVEEISFAGQRENLRDIWTGNMTDDR